MRQNRTAYGGKVGLWLKKKKKPFERTKKDELGDILHSHPKDSPVNLPNATISSNDRNNSEGGSDGLFKGVSRPGDVPPLKSLTSSSSMCLLEWDENLCRPIHRRHQETTKESNFIIGPDDGVSDPRKTSNDDRFLKRKELKGEYGKRFIYGNRNRGMSGLSLSTFSIIHECRSERIDPLQLVGTKRRKRSLPEEHKLSKRRRRVSKSKDDDGYKSYNKNNQFLTQASHFRTQFPRKQQYSNTSNQIGKKTKENERSTTSVGLFTKSSKNLPQDLFVEDKKSDNILNDNHKVKKCEFDFAEEHIVDQLSSKSSISVAKTYFQNLDSTENLIINSICDGDNQSKKHSYGSPNESCKRTSRAINIKCPKLKKEYTEYRKAIRDCGITPLSIREYANHRNKYFCRSGFCDGLLDEDP